MGNFAASLLAGDKAHLAGYTQVLWLDGVEQRYVEEVGSMNICFVIDGDGLVAYRGSVNIPALEIVIADAVAQVRAEIRPITDMRASAEYRARMCEVMLARGVRAAKARLDGDGPAYRTRLI